jgi:hypothetical protein
VPDTLTDGFAVFGYHVTGSSGALFLYGIVVGAVGLLGLGLLLAGVRRTCRRGRAARRDLKESRREATDAYQDRDRLAEQRVRVTEASATVGKTLHGASPPIPYGRRGDWRHPVGHRTDQGTMFGGRAP